MLILSLCLIALVNAVVTVAVVRSASYERQQKSMQCILIWLVPVAGAALAWYVLREELRQGTSRGNDGSEYGGYPGEGQSQSHHDGGADGGH